jgi:hypothetical protein
LRLDRPAGPMGDVVSIDPFRCINVLSLTPDPGVGGRKRRFFDSHKRRLSLCLPGDERIYSERPAGNSLLRLIAVCYQGFTKATPRNRCRLSVCKQIKGKPKIGRPLALLPACDDPGVKRREGRFRILRAEPGFRKRSSRQPRLPLVECTVQRRAPPISCAVQSFPQWTRFGPVQPVICN